MSDGNNKNWECLPGEIVTDIFLRLPIKSIIICTSVSKIWRRLIQNPSFISTHLIHHSNTNHNFLLSRPCLQHHQEFYTLHNEDDPDFTQHTRFDSPFHAPKSKHYNGTFRVVGMCNGLLCLVNEDILTDTNKLFLWNPCVRKFLKLPDPNITDFTLGEFTASIGFGFDPKTNDYKVVMVATLLHRLHHSKSRPMVAVYSLSTGKWRMFKDHVVPTCAVRGREPQAFVNGALHWLAWKRTNDRKFHPFVLVLHLGDEVFREISLPEFPGYTREGVEALGTSVSVYGNSITLFHNGYYSFERQHFSGCLNIWVMKEYGVASSWTKVLTTIDQDPGGGVPRALGFKRNGEVVLLKDGGRIILWNPENQNIKHLRITGYQYSFVGSYVESLVLLDKSTKGVVTY